MIKRNIVPKATAVFIFTIYGQSLTHSIINNPQNQFISNFSV
jgi:hypothetical protein